MHKYFAKTLFLGKKVEYLTECHSTNSELQLRNAQKPLQEGYVIAADNQVSGRGQRGNVWLSEPGKNLLFSILLKPKVLLPKQAYLINLIAGLSVVQALKESLGIDTELKWPNDVYVADKKIAGILVETNIEKGAIGSAVVGIGLNVNQSHFQLPIATSIKLETQQSTDRVSLLEVVLQKLERYYLQLKSGQVSKILTAYYRVMRWRGEIHAFSSDHEVFEGEIIGIDDTGRLLVKTKELTRRFHVKQIEFLH